MARGSIAFLSIVSLSLAVIPNEASAKASTSINVVEGKETFASVGDVVVKVSLKKSLPNAFGGADIFGRKRDRGFIEVRFMGIGPGGRAVFRRRTVDIYSNETTMSRSGMQSGSAHIEVNGNSADVDSYSVGPQRATIEALPPDTVEFSLDLSKNRLVTVEDRLIEIRFADEGGVKFVVTKR